MLQNTHSISYGKSSLIVSISIQYHVGGSSDAHLDFTTPWISDCRGQRQWQLWLIVSPKLPVKIPIYFWYPNRSGFYWFSLVVCWIISWSQIHLHTLNMEAIMPRSSPCHRNLLVEAVTAACRQIIFFWLDNCTNLWHWWLLFLTKTMSGHYSICVNEGGFIFYVFFCTCFLHIWNILCVSTWRFKQRYTWLYPLMKGRQAFPPWLLYGALEVGL
jgi:hypothetical protein